MSVVCVDDDPDILELIRLSAAREPDFEVVDVAADSTGVLTLLRQHHPDVVILDHGLGDMGEPVIDLRDGRRGGRGQLGLELVEMTRDAVPQATIVIFTGWDGLHAAARNVGADLIIEKPAIDSIWPSVREVRSARTTGDGR